MIGLADEMAEKNIKIGRDKFFDFLRNYDLQVKPRKRYARTTNSMHRFYKYKNLIKEFKPTQINQLWVSDITYIKTHNGFCYLALITDAYSRKIVGYDVSNSLELAGVLAALNKAIKLLPDNHQLIHHSDRGIQYCSYAYTDLLIKKKVKISMTENGNCYENAMAERVNGILKTEFYLDHCFDNINQAKKACEQAIEIYNNQRLHMALNYKTPQQMHQKVA